MTMPLSGRPSVSARKPRPEDEHMNPLSLYAGIVITQELEDLRNEAARAVLARPTRWDRGSGSGIAAGARRLAKAFSGGPGDPETIVPPLRDYPYSPTR